MINVIQKITIIDICRDDISKETRDYLNQLYLAYHDRDQELEENIVNPYLANDEFDTAHFTIYGADICSSMKRELRLLVTLSEKHGASYIRLTHPKL